jgi:tRNA 2-thiouridine synthesizing protein A
MPILEIDAKRLLCPMPVIRLQNAIKTLSQGAQIKIFCTDPGVLHDIPTWCRLYGHRVISVEETEEAINFLIEVI